MDTLTMAHRNEIPQYSESDRDRVESELALRELAYRHIGGLSIFLYWHKKSNTLSEAVIDERSRRTVVFPVPNNKGLDAFYHPFPYAYREGLDFPENRQTDD